ncbi:YbaK/EbsC family protein [Streptomyces atratus]|uniref:YbaK/EbsC family protein n=1 Tax=Streptomyces atratus TaxID=1893 RepID=UPI002AC3181F|nr:YbaK/EbsC family protein [Streptomyces atratus]WPW26101.1 YbaK/EbsC family protein [Streptomyces atratus]
MATGKRSRRYVLAVVPGDRRVDLAAPAGRYGGRETPFADREVAGRPTGSVSGSITPFAVSCEPDLPADENLLVHEEICFDAGRLDLSAALSVSDCPALAEPASRREPRDDRGNSKKGEMAHRGRPFNHTESAVERRCHGGPLAFRGVLARVLVRVQADRY